MELHTYEPSDEKKQLQETVPNKVSRQNREHSRINLECVYQSDVQYQQDISSRDSTKIYQQFFRGIDLEESELLKRLVESDIRYRGKDRDIGSKKIIEFLGIMNSEDYEFLIIRVRIDCFELDIKVQNSEEEIYAEKDYNIIGRGASGYVYGFVHKDIKIAVKSIEISDPQTYSSDLLNVIKEYTLLKICSALEVGPSLNFESLSYGAQIVCYPQRIQFLMEYCEYPSEVVDREENLRMEESLKRALKIMHYFRLMHLDIKTENISYSSIHRKWIFLDFGCTAFVKESLGYKSLTKFVGSYAYASKQMQNLFCMTKECAGLIEGRGYVDLYYNDYHGLVLCFKRMKNKIYENQEMQSLNSPRPDQFFILNKFHLWSGDFGKFQENFQSRYQLKKFLTEYEEEVINVMGKSQISYNHQLFIQKFIIDNPYISIKGKQKIKSELGVQWIGITNPLEACSSETFKNNQNEKLVEMSMNSSSSKKRSEKQKTSRFKLRFPFEVFDSTSTRVEDQALKKNQKLVIGRQSLLVLACQSELTCQISKQQLMYSYLQVLSSQFFPLEQKERVARNLIKSKKLQNDPQKLQKRMLFKICTQFIEAEVDLWSDIKVKQKFYLKLLQLSKRLFANTVLSQMLYRKLILLVEDGIQKLRYSVYSLIDEIVDWRIYSLNHLSDFQNDNYRHIHEFLKLQRVSVISRSDPSLQIIYEVLRILQSIYKQITNDRSTTSKKFSRVILIVEKEWRLCKFPWFKHLIQICSLNSKAVDLVSDNITYIDISIPHQLRTIMQLNIKKSKITRLLILQRYTFLGSVLMTLRKMYHIEEVFQCEFALELALIVKHRDGDLEKYNRLLMEKWRTLTGFKEKLYFLLRCPISLSKTTLIQLQKQKSSILPTQSHKKLITIIQNYIPILFQTKNFIRANDYKEFHAKSATQRLYFVYITTLIQYSTLLDMGNLQGQNGLFSIEEELQQFRELFGENYCYYFLKGSFVEKVRFYNSQQQEIRCIEGSLTLIYGKQNQNYHTCGMQTILQLLQIYRKGAKISLDLTNNLKEIKVKQPLSQKLQNIPDIEHLFHLHLLFTCRFKYASILKVLYELQVPQNPYSLKQLEIWGLANQVIIDTYFYIQRNVEGKQHYFYASGQLNQVLKAMVEFGHYEQCLEIFKGMAIRNHAEGQSLDTFIIFLNLSITFLRLVAQKTSQDGLNLLISKLDDDPYYDNETGQYTFYYSIQSKTIQIVPLVFILLQNLETSRQIFLKHIKKLTLAISRCSRYNRRYVLHNYYILMLKVDRKVSKRCLTHRYRTHIKTNVESYDCMKFFIKKYSGNKEILKSEYSKLQYAHRGSQRIVDKMARLYKETNLRRLSEAEKALGHVWVPSMIKKSRPKTKLNI